MSVCLGKNLIGLSFLSDMINRLGTCIRYKRTIPSAFQWLFMVAVASLSLACNPKPSEKNQAQLSDQELLNQMLQGFNAQELKPDYVQSAGDTLHVALIGHTYPLLKHADLFHQLIDAIESSEADLVMVLGDMVCYSDDEEWEILHKAMGRLSKPVYYAPGNHDINFYRDRDEGILNRVGEAQQRYINQIGYRYRLIQADQAQFVILNMSDSLNRLVDYLDHIDVYRDTLLPTFILSHQDIWATRLSVRSDPQSWAHKTFTTGDILDRVDEYDVFVSGDWNIEFREGTRDLSGKEVINYAVGMRVQGDPVYYTLATIYDGQISAEPRVLTVPYEHTWTRK